jgi:hypothetical protein
MRFTVFAFADETSTSPASLDFRPGRLLGQDVRMEGVIPLQLPGSGLPEPLGGATVALHLRHSYPL